MGKFKDGFNIAVKNGIGIMFNPKKTGEYLDKMIKDGEEIEKRYEEDKNGRN